MTDRNCEILYEYIQDILSDRQAQAPDPASMDACHRKLGEPQKRKKDNIVF